MTHRILEYVAEDRGRDRRRGRQTLAFRRTSGYLRRRELPAHSPHAALRTRSRRPTRHIGARRHGLSPRIRMGARRLPRRGRVFRTLGIPHHVAPARRVEDKADDRAGRLLGATGAPTAPGARATPPRGGPVCRARRAGRSARPPAGRGIVVALLWPQLAFHRGRTLILRRLRGPVAAAPPVVARDRGAVLRAVA